MKIFPVIVLLLAAHAAQALDAISISIRQIETEGWKLKGVELALSGLALDPQRLKLSIQRMILPEPLDRADFIDINCFDFRWGGGELICRKGEAKIKYEMLRPLPVNFTFDIRQNGSEFHVNGLKLGGGEVAFDGEAKGRNWHLNGTAIGVDIAFFERFFASNISVSRGAINFDFSAEGTDTRADKLFFTTLLDNVSAQTADGRRATEDAGLALSVRAHRERNRWHWQSRLEFRNGALYIEPLYLESAPQPITVNASGVWNGRSQRVDVDYMSYRHPGAGELTGFGTLGFKSGVILEQSHLSLKASELKVLSAIYMQPFLAETAMEGLTLEGRLNAEISIVQQALTECSLDFVQLNIDDSKGRFRLENGAGAIHWTSIEGASRPSDIAWRQLQFYNLPVGASKLSFSTQAKTIKLLEKARLPFLDGVLMIDRFDWQAKPQSDPDVYFVGAVERISLEQLTGALNWTPLTGTVSGTIPGVDYRDKKLTLEGELLINVFDGEISIKDLASSGLFSDFPQVYGDITVNNLDLDQLTRKFKIGGIEGRLSGFIQELYLENWRPVTFYAWLGTPENDESRHRISQKAVENLASIGGGGATDLVSRTFLRFFDTFGYDRLGLGCYLHQGVCQLMGVEPASQGYYIVKGGGLPRIDVIGYNPRIDWNVLLERLARITATNEAVID
ncbi:MAG: C4-dicarboxylate ABC transporter [Gammaproteobacteria bacterium]